MKCALLSLAASVILSVGSTGTASAAGITICNGTKGLVAFAVGYVRAQKLEATGRFDSDPGSCATFVTDVAEGPFYLYARNVQGLMSWTAIGKDSAQAFCLSRADHFVSRNDDYMKEGKLVCPEGEAGQFIRVPSGPGETPKFTFSEDNATDRP